MGDLNYSKRQHIINIYFLQNENVSLFIKNYLVHVINVQLKNARLKKNHAILKKGYFFPFNLHKCRLYRKYSPVGSVLQKHRENLCKN